MNIVKITDEELNERIKLHHKRMSEPFYDIDNVFAPTVCNWPGDKEGRALLAFVSLSDIYDEPVPCMELFIKKLPHMLNEKGYLGEIKKEFFEQQLSGHSWLLRGLSAYYEKFGDETILAIINMIVENLYFPLIGKISAYPINREKGDAEGGADGHSAETHNDWILSTDTCCAFMSIDGLSHVYQITKDEKIKSLLDEMIDTFAKIDKQEIRAQTHCTLTAARGMMRLFSLTRDEKYLEFAREIFTIYTENAMTYNYENFNWWGRPDSWTEPCAVIDSLMVATELFKATGNFEYRTLAARIFHNGFPAMQRSNGGAGTQSIVYKGQPLLYFRSYETKQCCTMRLGEGLKYITENRDLLYAETYGNVVKDENGVYHDGDIIYAETVCDESHTLHPLIKYYKLTEEEIRALQQRLIF